MEKNDTLDEYDFTGGVRGKYAKAYAEGANIVKIDKDVSQMFPDSKSVNEALRTLIRLMDDKKKHPA